MKQGDVAPEICKQKLRALMRRRRQALTLASRKASAQSLAHTLDTYKDLWEGHAVAAYMGVHGELSLDVWMRQVLGASCGTQSMSSTRLCLPRVLGPGVMEFVCIKNLEQDLVPGSFGILEPAGEERIPLNEIDVFLVPGLAFSKEGLRLGQGGGFYDRALHQARAVRGQDVLFFGVGYAWQVLDSLIPVESHDVRMNGVFREHRLDLC